MLNIDTLMALPISPTTPHILLRSVQFIGRSLLCRPSVFLSSALAFLHDFTALFHTLRLDMTHQPMGLDKLPTELWGEILQYTTPKDLTRLMKVWERLLVGSQIY